MNHNKNPQQHNYSHLLSTFDRFFRWKRHQDTVGQNGDDNEKAKEWMHQHVDRYAANRIEGIEYPQRIRGAKAKYVFALADHSKSLVKKDKNNDIIGFGYANRKR